MQCPCWTVISSFYISHCQFDSIIWQNWDTVRGLDKNQLVKCFDFIIKLSIYYDFATNYVRFMGWQSFNCLLVIRHPKRYFIRHNYGLYQGSMRWMEWKTRWKKIQQMKIFNSISIIRHCQCYLQWCYISKSLSHITQINLISYKI